METLPFKTKIGSLKGREQVRLLPDAQKRIMNTSPARKEFKKRFGQANHFLITALVGIDGIQRGIISEKPESFHTSWNPNNKKRSADRTRVFVLKSFLGWAVESLEMYMTELNRKPKLLSSETFNSLFSKAGQSIYKKTIYIADEINMDPILIGLMEILITWRNYTFHYEIDNQIRQKSINCLFEKSEEIKNRFSGLDIIQLKNTWENNSSEFTFKETASLIKATQDFVEEVDKYVVSNINRKRFYLEAIEKKFRDNYKSKVKYESFNQEKKGKYLRVLLQNIAGADRVEDQLIKEIINELKNNANST